MPDCVAKWRHPRQIRVWFTAPEHSIPILLIIAELQYPVTREFDPVIDIRIRPIKNYEAATRALRSVSK